MQKHTFSKKIYFFHIHTPLIKCLAWLIGQCLRKFDRPRKKVVMDKGSGQLICLMSMVIPSETDFEPFTSCLELTLSIRHQCWYLLPLGPPGWLHSYWNRLLSHVASSSLILKNYVQPNPGWSLIKRTKDHSQQWVGYSTKTCRYINGDFLIVQFWEV